MGTSTSISFLLLACKTNPRFFSLGRFENVMALTAPAWSPASVQFTHGFPWHLIQAEQGGFLPGNIILTAKASNLAIRRMSVLDVASWPTVHRWSGSQLRPSAQPPVSSTWIFIFCDINGHANYLVGFLFPQKTRKNKTACKIRYNNLCIRFGTWRVRCLNQSRSKGEIPGWARREERLSHSKFK